MQSLDIEMKDYALQNKGQKALELIDTLKFNKLDDSKSVRLQSDWACEFFAKLTQNITLHQVNNNHGNRGTEYHDYANGENYFKSGI